jgi:DNA-binding protein HU-beta
MSKVINKEEFVAALAEKTGLSKNKAGECLSAMFEIVTKTLAKGNALQFVGFGSYSVKHRAARDGRNPRTGAKLRIAARKVPHFSAGKTLKDAVNKK